MPYKKIEVFGKEIALGQVFPIDVIVQYDGPPYNRLVIKKPSGQVFVQLQPRDQVKK
jgi:hypothetical protein